MKCLNNGFLILASLLTTLGCQPSDNKNDTSDPTAVALSSCEKLQKPSSLNGKWVTPTKTTGPIKENLYIKFEKERMSVTALASDSGLICAVSGSSEIETSSNSSFKILERIRNSNMVSNREKELRCSLNIPPELINYYFNGGCLVLKTTGGEITLLPSNSNENSKSPGTPNSVETRPQLPSTIPNSPTTPNDKFPEPHVEPEMENSTESVEL